MSGLVEVLDENQLEQTLQADLPVLVDFWAPWCGPCKAMMPVVLTLAEQYAGKVAFVKVNIDQLPAIASKYSIRGIPHCILFQKGTPLGAVTGLQPKKVLTDFLKYNLPTLREPL
jgi:thioredoxin 1